MTTATSPGPAPPAPSAGWARRTAGWCREHVAAPLLATVFPPRCVGCGEFETFLCRACRADLEPAGPERCPRCGHPGASARGPGWCPACVGQTPTFASARGVYLHEGPARRLVTSFKYDGLRVLGREMAGLAAEEFAALVASVRPVLVTWVPAHPSSVRARGYNQAEVLARELARPHGLPLVALARKRRRTEHQRGLDREGRLHNLRGAFVIVPEAAAAVSPSWAAVSLPSAEMSSRPSLPPSRAVTSSRSDVGPPPADATPSSAAPGDVVLVDDVFTTGATVAEVSRVVTEGWGVRVHVFTFSRAAAGFPQRAD